MRTLLAALVSLAALSSAAHAQDLAKDDWVLSADHGVGQVLEVRRFRSEAVVFFESVQRERYVPIDGLKKLEPISCVQDFCEKSPAEVLALDAAGRPVASGPVSKIFKDGTVLVASLEHLPGTTSHVSRLSKPVSGGCLGEICVGGRAEAKPFPGIVSMLELPMYGEVARLFESGHARLKRFDGFMKDNGGNTENAMSFAVRYDSHYARVDALTAAPTCLESACVVKETDWDLEESPVVHIGRDNKVYVRTGGSTVKAVDAKTYGDVAARRADWKKRHENAQRDLAKIKDEYPRFK